MNNAETALFKDKQLGFLIYLGVEAIMFTVLFITYFIYTPASSGPQPFDIFNWKTVVLASVFLLSSSGTIFMADRYLKKDNGKATIIWLLITLLLGLAFLGVEINEFASYIQAGYTTRTNVFMGAFYVLVGLHAAHVAFGCGWLTIILIHFKRKIPYTLFLEKQKIFSYYWHFVDLVWIVILVIVYIPYL
ncbi:cytochrome aa3 quinol oxidase subunit III [Sporosarcina sp. P16b]|uniref:cytochrome c oxidase subunit 3 n=1 Tax=Sporosarcina sp. P16b TaxID=2048261 RepID=UPI000C169D1C|nr:cytochrome c oxidase subunit 3 [Sporosarcina sp. P16b]PIC70272.1 cytochrome aa3 quinol oxidase subunit III [Sporosarcina sp. P16b]